jgi:hypothetical protein
LLTPYLLGKETNVNEKNSRIIFECALSNANTAMTNEVFDYVLADKIETSLAKT